jgi:chromosome segregation protein
MRVSRIEIFGFKSFMEKVVIPLDGGVTGVVGPNGCGKSNVVDALRWVLGETKASNLRGASLEDVIFNGTDKLRPLGLAEVSITLRSTEANFFADLVSPAMEADLVAQLAAMEIDPEEEGLNAQASTEVTPEEATSESQQEKENRPNLTVISGGLDEQAPQAEAAAEAVDAVASEAADAPSSAPAPTTESEEASKEPVAATFLTRFSWLKAVNEVQVTRRLYRSGESEFFINRVPCRLKDVKDFFRAIGLGARSHTIVAQGEVSRIVTAKPEERRLILEEAAGVLGFRDKIASATRRLEETGVNISRIDDILKEVERQVSSLKRQAARAEARQEIKDRLAVLEDALFLDKAVELRETEKQVESQRAGVVAEQERAEAALQLVQAQEIEARGQLSALDIESDTVRRKIDSLSEEIHQRERQRSGRKARIGEINAFVQARGTEARRLEERIVTLASRKTSAQQEILNLEEREKALSKEIAEFETGGEDELRQASESVTSKREQLRQREQELRVVREELISKQSSLRAAKEQLVANSPITQLKDTLSSPHSQFLKRLSESSQLLVDGLRVPPAYSKAAQAVLAERAQFLVTEDPLAVAEQFVAEAYSSHAQDKKKRSSLGVFKRAGLDATEAPEAARADIPFTRLLDVVEVNAEFALVAHRLLGAVYVADTLAAAKAFLNSGVSAKGITIVTQDGDILTEYSFYSLRHEGGVIQLKNKAIELEARVQELEAKQQELQKAKDEAQSALREAESLQNDALRRSRERQAKVRELVNQRGTVVGRLQAERRTFEQVDGDVLKTQQQVKECEHKIQELRAEEARLAEELKNLVPDQEQELKAELEKLQAEYASQDKVRREGREKLAHFANQVHAARQALDKARSAVNSLELSVQKVALERQNLRERIEIECGPEQFSVLLSRAEQMQRLELKVRQEFSEELGKLKSRIAREGEVDPSSIQRYEEERKRLEDLSAQRHDLDHAAQVLKRTIERLTETSEKRFVATFNAVRENFSKLVPRLFGGGRGSLELLDPSKPLDSGVEIIARPPGKKLKSIELMSGGEKALCATALILGMFMEKPSPLCVLDEVDAPLDEANLVRFLSLIKDMSKRTQFLMITHNKNSMATSDRLIGVTMQEPGASRTISVSLQEAYSQVA